MVTASEQSAGRGRHGRFWSAPAGKALLYSAILSPLEPSTCCCRSRSRSRSARRSRRRRRPAQIKWPNDVWLDGRKVAGVLIEARPPDGWAVIGIGVNVAIEPEEFPADLRWPATSVGGGASVAELHERLSGRAWPPGRRARARILEAFAPATPCAGAGSPGAPAGRGDRRRDRRPRQPARAHLGRGDRLPRRRRGPSEGPLS